VRRLFADTTPLRTPDFRRLWLAGIVTVIGANLTIFAVPVQLYALTQNSAYVGLSGCSRSCHWWCSACWVAPGPTRWTGGCC
jgi:hypothetical protein